MPTLSEKFWEKVNKDGPIKRADLGPCWEWIRGCSSSGYGSLRFHGTQHAAHRLGWVLQHGPFDAALFVLHHCDNKKCVRGSHLFLGTQKDNMADMDEKKRRVNPTGAHHGRAKLTEADVCKIRALAQGLPQTWIALQFSVTPSVVSRIVNNKAWGGRR